jgi:sugar phosphate isomerase/epimerase
LHGREDLGFTFDPVPFHWQGIDPVEFLRRFPERIYHVHISDATVTLNGKSGLLGSYLPEGDPRRGWQPRSPGRGGIEWESIIRALNEINYDGPLAVAWNDPGMDRSFGAEEACQFTRRLDFPSPPRSPDQAFR